jgi:dihydroorotase-like cyclic amidohydrolase
MLVGEDANVVVFDPAQRWTASRDSLQSRAVNTPYEGRAMKGRVRTLIAKGSLVVDEGHLT